MMQEKYLYMNLATLPDITEEILQEDNDEKEKVHEDHFEEKSKSDKVQIVNDKTEIKEQILQEDNDIKEKVSEDDIEKKSKNDKIQIVNDKTELSEIANIEEEEEVFKNAGGDEQDMAIETSII